MFSVSIRRWSGLVPMPLYGELAYRSSTYYPIGSFSPTFGRSSELTWTQSHSNTGANNLYSVLYLSDAGALAGNYVTYIFPQRNFIAAMREKTMYLFIYCLRASFDLPYTVRTPNFAFLSYLPR